MNKKGFSFSGWMEVIIFSLIAVIAVGMIFTDMNTTFSQNYNTGLPTDAMITQITNLQDNIQNKTVGGSASFGSVWGLTLSTSWEMIVTIFSVTGYFVGGSWISTIGGYLLWPSIVVLLIRTLYLLSLAFIILKILFRVRV